MGGRGTGDEVARASGATAVKGQSPGVLLVSMVTGAGAASAVRGCSKKVSTVSVLLVAMMAGAERGGGVMAGVERGGARCHRATVYTHPPLSLPPF